MAKTEIKILGISLAHRKGRNTAWMVEYALKAAEKFGKTNGDIARVETEFVDMANKKVELCRECRDLPCRPGNGPSQDKFGCVIDNDYLALELMPKVAEADGFVFGAPVYTGTATSQYIIVMERFRAGIWKGYFKNKPAGMVTTATMPMAGQDSTLQQMNNVARFLEMIPVSVGHGASSISGPPYGPLAADDDGKLIGVKNDENGQYQAVCVGRRVAEIAVLLGVAKQQLGDRYVRSFAQYYAPPQGDNPWAWSSLDADDHEAMMDLTPSTFRG